MDKDSGNPVEAQGQSNEHEYYSPDHEGIYTESMCPVCKKTSPMLTLALSFIHNILQKYEGGSTVTLRVFNKMLEQEYQQQGFATDMKSALGASSNLETKQQINLSATLSTEQMEVELAI